MAKTYNPIGALAFVVALVLALVLGALDAVSMTMATILVVLGLIVGLLNVTGKETKEFMLGGVVLVIISSMGANELGLMLPIFTGMLNGLMLVFVPATAVVAVKQMLSLAKH